MSSIELQNLFAKKFIARADVKAIQHSDGSWMPVREKKDGPFIPWKREDIERHLDSKQTFGHYLLSPEDTCKVLCFDIDLKKEPGVLPETFSEEGVPASWRAENDLRAAWHNRDPNFSRHRQWMKNQFRIMVHLLANTTHELLGLQVAATYSGNKGCHVYAFFNDLIPAKDATDGARLILEAIGNFHATAKDNESGQRVAQPDGNNFYQYLVDSQDWADRYDNLCIEVFPKQDSVGTSGLGNLVRLPLGVNLKNPQDPCFFIDLRAPMNQLLPVDAVWALTAQNPWSD